jgi:iodotyrosine deiodinase
MEPGFLPLEFTRLPKSEQQERSVRFRDRIATRRSVRQFSSEPVPWELIENAIVAAGTAPSGANQQPWTFVVVSDPATKRRIREAAEAEERRNYDSRFSDEYLQAIEPIGTDSNKPHLTDAPYVIVVFEQPYGVAPDGTKVKHYFVRESVGIAIGFLLMALHEAGLATLTHTPAPMGFLHEILGRPENERALSVIPVGYPADGATVPDITRKPLDEILVRR